MADLHLDVEGVRVRVSGDDREALDGIEAQFFGFVAAAAGRTDVRIDLAPLDDGAHSPLPERLVADQIVERGVVYNRGSAVHVDHHGRSWSSYDYETECGVVRARQSADFVEQAYLMIHSRLGVLLEARGLVRIHACGFVLRGRAGLVLAPSGGGKSRMALALLRVDPEVELLGDDMVLLDRSGHAHPFPHPIGVSDPELARGLGPARLFERRAHGDKWVIGGEALLARHAHRPAPVRLVALLTRASAPPTRLIPEGRRAMARALFRDAVIGLGLPQVIEMVARRGARDLIGMGPSAALRSRAVAGLLWRAEAARLESYDPADAARQLLERLRRD